MQYLALSFLLTLFTLVLLVKTRLGRLVLDQPNQRSLHTNVVPRTGGLAIMAGVLASWLMTAEASLWLALIVGLIMISLLDDIFDLAASWRLLAQLLVSSLFIWGYASQPHLWLMLALVLALTWMVNLYNFMDGSDGLAGGMAFFGFSTYAIAAYLAQDSQLALMSATVAAASLAFLFFNFHPARIFMGDAGSVPLGFLAGSIGLYGYTYQLWSWWFPLLVFSPFIADASVTLLKRALRGEKIWQAHRSHYYQRLVQMGWGHQKTALAEYAIMVTAGALAITLINAQQTTVLIALLFYALAYGILMLWLDKRWHKFQQTVTSF